jgi:hypothetical protein
MRDITRKLKDFPAKELISKANFEPFVIRTYLGSFDTNAQQFVAL